MSRAFNKMLPLFGPCGPGRVKKTSRTGCNLWRVGVSFFLLKGLVEGHAIVLTSQLLDLFADWALLRECDSSVLNGCFMLCSVFVVPNYCPYNDSKSRQVWNMFLMTNWFPFGQLGQVLWSFWTDCSIQSSVFVVPGPCSLFLIPFPQIGNVNCRF